MLSVVFEISKQVSPLSAYLNVNVQYILKVVFPAENVPRLLCWMGRCVLLLKARRKWI